MPLGFLPLLSTHFTRAVPLPSFGSAHRSPYTRALPLRGICLDERVLGGVEAGVLKGTGRGGKKRCSKAPVSG